MKLRASLGLSAAALVAVLGLTGCKQENVDASTAETPAPAKEAAANLTKAEETKPEAAAASATPEELITASLTTNLPKITVISMAESAAKGIYQVEIGGGEVIHVTADGKHILNGDLLAITTSGIENITEVWRSEKRIAVLNSIKDEDLVVYPAQGEEKGSVIAFTDTSCGYCQKLHQEIPQLNKMGITLKYAAWPRYGVQSQAGQIMSNIWCSKDREHAMTLAKTRQPVAKPEGDCDVSALNEQLEFGRQLGVRGTPALFLSDGRKIGGYRKAADLAAEFGIAEAR